MRIISSFNKYIEYMDYYINRILNYTKMSCNECDIKKDIIDDLDLIFELYCDFNDKRLH